MSDTRDTLPLPPEILRLRGDAAISLLQLMLTEYKERAAIIEEFFTNIDALDKSYGMEAMSGKDGAANLLATTRKAMPHLAHLSDEILIKTFGKK